MPFSLIAHSLERTDPEARLAPEAAEFLEALRTRYSVASRADHLCGLRPSATGDERAWNELVRMIEKRSHPVGVPTLPVAIEQLEELYTNPMVRRSALAAAKKLLDCPRGYEREAELHIIALGASALEIDHQEVRKEREAELDLDTLKKQVTPIEEEQGSVSASTLDARAIALYEAKPLPTERALYPVNKLTGGDTPDGPPRLCLALSGGGIRSAAFQIGVLQGLHDSGLLSKIDVISAVSGGSYAMSWFIASRLEEAGVRHAIRDDWFLSGYYYADYIRSGKKVSPPHLYTFLNEANVSAQDSRFAHLVSLPEAAFLAVAGLPAALIEAPYDSLTTDLPSFLLEHRNYVRLLREAYSIPDYSLAGLALRLAQVPDLAYPVFSATARAGTCSEESSPTVNLRASSFEFAPSQVGLSASESSSAAPYYYTVADAAAISGAAMDVPFGLACLALERAQARLGARLPGPERYVTDGGFSDNLALAPLLLHHNRNCQAIIVADAGYDPHLAFSSYQLLAEALEQENIGTLKVKGIDQLIIKDKDSSRASTKEDSTPAAKFDKEDKEAPRRARQQECGWFIGRFRMSEASEGEEIPLLYLKMSINERELDPYPKPVADAIVKCRRPDCEFPHIRTFGLRGQTLPKVYFRGLRHLGQHLVKEAVKSGEWPPTGPALTPNGCSSE